MSNQDRAEGVKLPELPQPSINTSSHAHIRIVGYTADQMRAYAQTALATQQAPGADTPGGRGEAVEPTGDIVDSLAQITVARYTLRNSQLPADVREVLKMAARALSHPAESSGGDAGQLSDAQIGRLLDWQPITYLNRGDRLWQILCNAGMPHGPALIAELKQAIADTAIASGAEHGR